MAGDMPGPGDGPANRARPEEPAAPLALYRRYRPASFAEVKGQAHVTEPLRQALRSGRVHHAYLFSGPRGCGKTSSARILARSLNCESGPTPDPCGTCDSCVALAPSGPGSIDVIEIDAASHGGVDDARDLRERAFYAPVSGRFKIYIIDEAHMVTREGFNALLKLVEEPPPHLKFVFATTEPEKVISTIRSRTHHYPFRLVPPAILRELLEQILASEKVPCEPAVLPVVIRAGAGSVRDSLSVLDQLIAGSGESGLRYEQATGLLGYTDERLLDEVAEALADGDGAAVFRAVDRVVEGGHDPRRFAADLLDRLRDLIVLAAVPGPAAAELLGAPADRLDRMREQAERFGQVKLASAAETINAGLAEMRGATSPRLQLELMCAQVLLPPAGAGPLGLLARLERLEHRLEGAAPVAEAATPASSRGRAVRAAAAPSAPGTARRSGPPDGAPAAAGPASPAQAAPPRSAAVKGASAPSVPAPAAPAGEAGRPATAGTGPPSAARTRPPSATRTGPNAAPADAGALREQWPAVLEEVRRERKVAWILLSNATVDSLADGILTLRFAREGDARGFTGSGCDRDLGQVLQAMFGIAPHIRTTSGPGNGQHGAGGGPGAGGPQAGGTGADSGPAAPGDPATAAGSRPRAANQAEAADADQADEAALDDSDALAGTDLIERELGGRVIRETGGA